MTLDLGIEPGPHWWKASALTTVPSQHPQKMVKMGKIGGKDGKMGKIGGHFQCEGKKNQLNQLKGLIVPPADHWISSTKPH